MRREAKKVIKKEIRKDMDAFMTKMAGSAKGVKGFWKYWAKLKRDTAEKVTPMNYWNENIVKGPEVGDLII